MPMSDFFRSAGKQVASGLKGVAGHVGAGVTLGVAGAATAGVGIAATKAYEAVTRGSDFKAMMANPFNRDLKDMHDRNPEAFNAAYNGLRDANHQISANPMTAGAYMRRMLEFSPEAAGGVLIEARNNRLDELNPLQDAFHRGALEGTKTHYQEKMRDRSELERESRMPDLKRREMEATHDIRMKFERDRANNAEDIFATRRAPLQEKMDRNKADYAEDLFRDRRAPLTDKLERERMQHAEDLFANRRAPVMMDLEKQKNIHRREVEMGYHPLTTSTGHQAFISPGMFEGMKRRGANDADIDQHKEMRRLNLGPYVRERGPGKKRP